MRVHLVDGTFELFRAHFSKRPAHVDAKGKDLKATVGVVSSLLTLLEDRDEAVTHLAAAFDNPIVSFRNGLFEGYKSDEGVPPELRAQFDDVERGVAALGVTVWRMDEFEADDALATGAARFSDDPRVEQVVICSPDKDLAQCVTGQRVVCLDRARKRLLDEPGVHEKFGVGPSSIPDYLALVGDDADGIPGVPRWGARSAAALLARYGRIEAIPADSGAWDVKVRGAAALARELSAHSRDAQLYKELATLRRDVPLAERVEDLAWQGANRAELESLCAEIDERSLPARVVFWRN